MRIKYATGEVKLNPVSHDQVTLAFDRDGSVLLPPIDQCPNLFFQVLTIGKAEVSIETADSASLISTGGRDTVPAIVVGGHQLYAVLARGNWQVFGSCGVSHQELPPRQEPSEAKRRPKRTHAKT